MIKIFIGFLLCTSILDADLREQFYGMQEELNIPPKETGTLRLLTWNVQKQIHNKLDLILEDLKKIDADIILFQEAFQNLELIHSEFFEIKHEWEQKIGALFDDVYIRKCYPSSNKSLRNQSLVCIANREILSSHSYIFEDPLQEESWLDTQFGFQTILLDTPIGKMYVINVHLIPGGSGDKRMKQIQILLDYTRANTDPQIPLLIVGDFNSLNYRQLVKNNQLESILLQDIHRGQSTPLFELEALYREGFQEVYDILDREAPSVTVWSQRRVDYLFTKESYNLSFEPFLMKRTHSDHFPQGLDIKTRH